MARNLGAGDNMRLPDVRTIPLHEKLLTALCYLLAEGELPLNRNGAAGWLTGHDLWLVSKRTADALRAHLLREGHGGIPSGNDRIFDVLQEHRLIIPNGERAIWRAQVAGDGWGHDLTLLRLIAAQVWPDPESRPEQFAGSVTPTEDAGATAKAATTREPVESDSYDGPASSRVLSSADDESSPERPQACHDVAGRSVGESSAASDTDTTSDSPDSGRRFLEWLRAGVECQRIPVNSVNARVHVVPEGVLLVSPGIFKEFAVQHLEEDWSHVQKRFQKLKVHHKTESGTNIHRYRVAGGRKQSAVNGLLVPDAAVVFGESPPPAANPHLSRGN